VNPDVSWSWIDALGDVTLSIATLKLAKYGLLEEALVTTYRASYKSIDGFIQRYISSSAGIITWLAV
jgi:hypothetical protein